MAETILAKLAVEVTAKTAQFGKALAEQEKALSGFSATVKNISTTLGVAFGTQQLIAFAGDVIRVTSEFEKFQAVLTNTLGSSSQAQKALDSIREFAKATPFEVSEITAAYVRWANQGLNPTIDKMGKLGDIASSLGAGFEQTAEAFKDLLVGQTKRIEEIGISAQQSNGKIQLSFKGVNLEIDKSVEGVERALEVYSSLNGVVGTSAQVSQTLGGKISNLKDSYDQLLLTIGQGTGGTLKDLVDLFIDITNAASNLLKLVNDNQSALGKLGLIAGTIVKSLLLPTKLILGLINNTAEANKNLGLTEQELKNISATADAAFNSGNVEAYIKALDSTIHKEEIIAEIRKRQAEEKDDGTKNKIKTLADLGEELKKLNDDFINKTDVNDKKKLENIGNEIIAIDKQIDALNKLKQARDAATPGLSTFGQAQLTQAESGEMDPFGGVKQVSTEIESARDGIDTTPLFASLFPEETETQARGEAMLDMLAEIRDSYGLTAEQQIAWSETKAKIDEDDEKAQQRKIAAAWEFGDAVGRSIGHAINAQQSFAKSMKKITKDIIGLFLSRALAAAITSSFESSKNPWIGAALAAASSAVVLSLFSGLGASAPSGGGGGGGGGGSRNVSNVDRLSTQKFGDSISFDANFRISGTDLVAVASTQQNRNNRLG